MKQQNTIHKHTNRNLIIFSVLVLASGWLGYGLDKVIESPPGEPGLGMLLWLTLPLLTVLFLCLLGGDSWRDLGLWPLFKGNLKWYITSLLIYPLVGAVILTIGGLLGFVTAPHFSITLLLSVFITGLIPAFIKNIFEELAWRGYLSPKVHSLGWPILIETVFVGLIWGCWHIPYLLFMLDPAIIQATTTQSMTTFIPMILLNLIAASLVYNEIRLLTNSVWPPLLLHTISNALIDVLIVQGFFKITPGWDFLFSPGHQSLLTLGCFTLIGLGLHQQRLKNSHL